MIAGCARSAQVTSALQLFARGTHSEAPHPQSTSDNTNNWHSDSILGEFRINNN